MISRRVPWPMAIAAVSVVAFTFVACMQDRTESAGEGGASDPHELLRSYVGEWVVERTEGGVTYQELTTITMVHDRWLIKDEYARLFGFEVRTVLGLAPGPNAIEGFAYSNFNSYFEKFRGTIDPTTRTIGLDFEMRHPETGELEQGKLVWEWIDRDSFRTSSYAIHDSALRKKEETFYYRRGVARRPRPVDEPADPAEPIIFDETLAAKYLGDWEIVSEYLDGRFSLAENKFFRVNRNYVTEFPINVEGLTEELIEASAFRVEWIRQDELGIYGTLYLQREEEREVIGNAVMKVDGQRALFRMNTPASDLTFDVTTQIFAPYTPPFGWAIFSLRRSPVHGGN